MTLAGREIEFAFIGDSVPVEREQALLGVILEHGEGVLTPGNALALPARMDDAPPDHWYINRVIYAAGKITLVLEKGFPLRPLTGEQVRESVAAFVSEMAAKRLTPSGQVSQLTDFISRLFKGRVFSGS